MRPKQSFKFAVVAVLLSSFSGMLALTGCVVKEKEKVIEPVPVHEDRR
jgi:hypothetical protein